MLAEITYVILLYMFIMFANADDNVIKTESNTGVDDDDDDDDDPTKVIINWLLKCPVFVSVDKGHHL